LITGNVRSWARVDAVVIDSRTSSRWAALRIDLVSNTCSNTVNQKYDF
jgi:hypothetical protein